MDSMVPSITTHQRVPNFSELATAGCDVAPKRSFEELACFIQERYDVTAISLQHSDLCSQLQECKTVLFGERHQTPADRQDFVSAAHSLYSLKGRCTLWVEGQLSSIGVLASLPKKLSASLRDWDTDPVKKILADSLVDQTKNFLSAISDFLKMRDEASAILESPVCEFNQINDLVVAYEINYPRLVDGSRIEPIATDDIQSDLTGNIFLDKIKMRLLSRYLIIAHAIEKSVIEDLTDLTEAVRLSDLQRESQLVTHITQDIEIGDYPIVLGGSAHVAQSSHTIRLLNDRKIGAIFLTPKRAMDDGTAIKMSELSLCPREFIKNYPIDGDYLDTAQLMVDSGIAIVVLADELESIGESFRLVEQNCHKCIEE